MIAKFFIGYEQKLMDVNENKYDEPQEDINILPDH